jgi:hypothetical protein
MSMPIELSFSRIGDLGCPYMFQQKYIRGLERQDSWWAHVGTIAHNIIGDYTETMVALNQRRALRNYGHQKGHAGILEDRAKKYLQGESPETESAVRDALNNFMHSFKIEDKCIYTVETRLYVDRDFRPCAPDSGVDMFAGTPDVVKHYGISGHWWVADYKMGWQRFGRGELAPQPDGRMTKLGTQLKTYAGLVMLCDDDIDLVYVEAIAPRFFSYDNYEWRRDDAVPWLKEWAGRAWRRVDALASEYGERDWPCESCANCQYCDIPCPMDVVNKIIMEAM